LEPDVSASLKLFALAGAVAVVAAAQPAQAKTHRAHASPRMATLAGSASRSLAGANVIGHAAPSSSVDVSVFLKPRHPKLLARLAAGSSARPGLSAEMTNFLFRPSAAQRAQLSAYMRSQGFRLTGQGMLVSSFAGTAAQAQRAFGVSLARYRGADGATFRAPTGAVRLPASIAGHVLSVDGLSTQVLVHPAGLVRKHTQQQPNALTGCTQTNNLQTLFPNTFQPQDLAAAGAYDSQTLLDGGFDGTGESIALVEFSGGNANALKTFRTCYGLTVPNTRVNVNGGTSSTAGAIEVDLDQEVAVSQAPGLDHLWTYVAKPSASQAAVLDAMLHQHTTRHIHIVSDSWGLCQPFEPLGQAASTNQELELLAVNGISFFAASGDDGSSDCHPFNFNSIAVDDPAGQPYATGVGGTQLTSTGPLHENVWGGHGVKRGAGGGGVSVLFRKPPWQKGPGVIRSGLSSTKRCGGKTFYCREVPDIAFNADPQTGYIINDGGWDIVGGTSAAAPLMAAFTADANEFSLANGGMRMGFANPFLYHQATADPAMFHDVTTGSNNLVSTVKNYKAATGYDMASGWGSIDVNKMAQDLAGYTRSAQKVQLTKITGNASRNPVVAHHPSKLSGKLTNTSTHHAMAGQSIWFIGVSGNRVWVVRLHTGPKGGWSITFKRKQLKKRLQWVGLYLGEQGHRPAETPVRTLRIG
jgi:subtilase family serine protease